MGKIDMSNFPCRKGEAPYAPHVPQPKEMGAKIFFEQLLFLKRLKIRSASE
jgi:hypothetical protein